MAPPKSASRSARTGNTGTSVNSEPVASVMEWRFPSYNYIHRYKSDGSVDALAKKSWKQWATIEGNNKGRQYATGIRSKWLYVLNNEGAKRTLKAEICVDDDGTCYEKRSPNPKASPSKRFKGARGKRVGWVAGLESTVPVSVDRDHKWFFFLSPVQLDSKAINLLLDSDKKDLLVEEDFSKSRGDPTVLVPDPYQWTEDSQAFHYLYHLNQWREYVAGCDFRGVPLKGAQSDEFKGRAAKQFISRVLIRQMGGPKEFLMDPLDPGSTSEPPIPETPPQDDLGIKDVIKVGKDVQQKNGLKHRDWKVPYEFMQKFFKKEYGLRRYVEEAAKNTLDWVMGTAHQLIDGSILRNPDLVSSCSSPAAGAGSIKGVPSLSIWVGVDHWGKILAWMAESEVGRTFLKITCEPPRAGMPAYFPSRVIYVDKKYGTDFVTKHLVRSSLALQLFALAYPVMLKHLPPGEAQELAQRYYGLLGVGVVKKSWGFLGATAKLHGLALEKSIRASPEQISRMRALVADLWRTNRGFRWALPNLSQVENLQRIEGNWDLISRHHNLVAERDALARALDAEGGHVVVKEKAEPLRIWEKTEKAIGYVSWMLVAADAYQAWEKKFQKGMAKSAFEILSILAKVAGQQALESMCKAFTGAVDMIIQLEKAGRAAGEGNVPQAVGYGMAAGGIFLLAAAAAAGSFPGVGWLIALGCLLAAAGAGLGAVSGEPPQRTFARFCIWGKGHNDPTYDRGGEDLKWLKGSRWKDFWTSGKKELAGLKRQVECLVDLLRRFAVESYRDGDKGPLWLIIHPGIPSRTADFKVELDGSGMGHSFGTIQYGIDPLLRKWKLESRGNLSKEYEPGDVQFRKGGDIAISFPFPDVSEAKARVELVDCGPAWDILSCDHTVKEKSSWGNPYPERKMTLSDV